MESSRRHADGRRVWWLAPLLAATGTVATVSIAAFLVTLRVARLVIVPVTVRPEDVTVRAVDRRAGTVRLSDHPDAVIPGRYSLYFAGDRGHARVGPIVGMGRGYVTRRLVTEQRGTLRAGLAARVSGIYYESPADIGLPFEDVTVQTELGPAPAWLVPADRPDAPWVIQVHGRGVDRREAVRALPAFHGAGYSSLLISYRNDGVAPSSPDGRYALGDTEWEDVEVAIRFARGRGARELILMGWSMGGAIVLQTVTRSPLAGSVRGIILESPVIDWVRVLDHQAGTRRIPGPIRLAVYRLISSTWGRWFTRQSSSINLARLDFVARAAELSLPTLLLHSDSDTFVPAAGSRALAQLRRDIVTFVPFFGAGHTRLWNYDPERWNRSITEWLASVAAHGGPVRRPSSP